MSSTSKHNLVALISCMHQTDKSILTRMNIKSSFVVVNQCDDDCVEDCEYTAVNGVKYNGKFVNTKERGLSNSRNMAIKYAPLNSICVLCDEDEVLNDDYENIILNAYGKYHANVILFDVLYSDYKTRLTVPQGKISFKKILSSHSVQITFKKEAVQDSAVKFDEKMGAGTGNGGGEEIKFLYDLYKKGIEMYSDNNVIARLLPSESSWFNGYNELFFLNYGWSTHRWAGSLIGYAYIWYYAIVHHRDYADQCSILSVIKNLHKGFFSKR